MDRLTYNGRNKNKKERCDVMQKVDKPKKPLFIYYLIVLAVIVFAESVSVPEAGRITQVTEVVQYIFDNAK